MEETDFNIKSEISIYSSEYTINSTTFFTGMLALNLRNIDYYQFN